MIDFDSCWVFIKYIIATEYDMHVLWTITNIYKG